MNFKLPHFASTHGYELFKSISKGSYSNEEKELLLLEYKQRLRSSGYKNIISNQLKYATKIAESHYILESEEANKLISLCFEIFALVKLDLEYDKSEVSTFRESFKVRFLSQKGLLKYFIKKQKSNLPIDIWSEYPFNNLIS